MYQQMIRRLLDKDYRIGIAPRHIEAWMRLEHGCLDGLSESQFRSEVKTAIECIIASTDAENESLAQSFGL